MIKHEIFTYTDEQWNAIRAQVLDDLGVDVDQIVRQVTFRHNGSDFEESFTVPESLRSRIESAVNQYHLYRAVNRLSPRRDELVRLRKDAEKLRASIISALSTPLDVGYGVVVPILLNETVDANMLTDTGHYFGRLSRCIDRQIEQARLPRDNARNTARDPCWRQLLAIWVSIGGKPRGVAAARFLRVASKPVMGSAVTDDNETVVKWLERHQS
jgi:hypothetical protein